jgi:predicted glycosyltransferase involved in capsule biosynthesis
MIKATMIISYKEDNEDRKTNLYNTLEFLSTLRADDMETIIVEQDTKSKLKWLKNVKNIENIKHIFIENQDIFNKGKGYNIGAQEASNDILIFNDADVLINLYSYYYYIRLIENFDVIDPYKRIYLLNEEHTKTFVDDNFNFDTIKKDVFIDSGVISGGIFLMKKPKYILVDGFDERYYGHGYEDCAFDIKIKDMKIYKSQDFAIHMYHNVDDDDFYYKRMSFNQKLYNDLLEKTFKISTAELIRKKYASGSFGMKELAQEFQWSVGDIYKAIIHKIF